MGFNVLSPVRQRGHSLVEGQVSFDEEREETSGAPGDCGTALGKGRGQAGMPLPNISACWLPNILRGASWPPVPVTV